MFTRTVALEYPQTATFLCKGVIFETRTTGTGLATNFHLKLGSLIVMVAEKSIIPESTKNKWPNKKIEWNAVYMTEGDDL